MKEYTVDRTRASGSSVSSNVVEFHTQSTTLECGLTVATETIPTAQSVAIGVWIGVGSRDEQAHESGTAHFLEHLLFKGTLTRTALDIANSIDASGGEINAFTTKENTCYYVQVLGKDLHLGLEVLCDIVLNGQCKKSDIDVERAVVFDEIAMQNDDCEDYINDLILDGLYRDTAIARPILGTTDSIRGLTAKSIREFHKRWYTPANMVLSVVGAVEHGEVVAAAEKLFRDVPTEVAPQKSSLRYKPSQHASFRTKFKHIEQNHVSLGFVIGGRTCAYRYPSLVLSTALGGGISSRLFQAIREERGLAYSVYSSMELFRDTGMLAIYLACQHKGIEESLRLTHSIISEVCRSGISQAELERAQGSLCGSLILSLEDISQRMLRLGRHKINYGTINGVQSTIDAIEAVDLASVSQAAQRTFSGPVSVAFLGPVRGKKKRLAMLQGVTKKLS